MTPTSAVGAFQHAAAQITERASELLSAPVRVVDEHGHVVARSNLFAEPSRAHPAETQDGPAFVRVPFHYATRHGSVIVSAPSAAEPLSPRLAEALLDLMITQTAVVSRLPNQHELKDKFIHDLLLGGLTDDADILREAQVLGMDFSRPRAVILIDAHEFILTPPGSPGDEALANRRAQLLIASIVGFFDLPNDTICGYIGNGEIAILKASATRDLAAWNSADGRPALTGPSWANLHALKRAAEALHVRLRRDTGATMTIGVGRYHPGVRGLAQSYRDAQTALSLGRRSAGETHVHCLASLGMAALVGVPDENTKAELAGRLLSPLNNEPELRHTLGLFFDQNCCPSSTARSLGIHRNTLSYRLDKVATLTDLDPRRFDDAIQIRVAMLLRRLHSADD
jgi:carbohydrate diacid regulator